MRTLLIAVATLAPVVALAQDAASPPPAQTGNAVADAFVAIIDTAYDGVTVGSARDEGGATLITDVKGTTAEGNTLDIGTVRIENGRVGTDTGGAPELATDSVDYGDVVIGESDSSKVAMGSMTMTGVTLGASTPGPSVLGSNDFATADIESITVTTETGAEMTIARANARLTPNGDGKSLDFTLTDLKADNAALGEGAVQLQALGYNGFTADMKVDAAWDGTSGVLDIRTVSLQADEVGTLDLTLGADGLTDQALVQMESAGGDFASILGAAQTINVKNLTVRYSDAGLVARLLDKTAADAGIDRTAVVDGAVAQVGAGLATLNNPEFATQVSDAIRSFLGTPGTLTVSATPPSAIPLAQVIGGAMMAPQSLPEMLNLVVSAGR